MVCVPNNHRLELNPFFCSFLICRATLPALRISFLDAYLSALNWCQLSLAFCHGSAPLQSTDFCMELHAQQSILKSHDLARWKAELMSELVTDWMPFIGFPQREGCRILFPHVCHRWVLSFLPCGQGGERELRTSRRFFKAQAWKWAYLFCSHPIGRKCHRATKDSQKRNHPLVWEKEERLGSI